MESEKRRRRQRRKTRRERESPPLPLSVILAHSQVAGVQKNAFSRVADLFFGPTTNKEGLRSAHMARLAVFLKRSGSKTNGEKEKRKKSTLTVLHSFSALSLSLSSRCSPKLARLFHSPLSEWIFASRMAAPNRRRRRRRRLQQQQAEKEPLPLRRRHRRACNEEERTLLRRSTRAACSLRPLQATPAGAPRDRP